MNYLCDTHCHLYLEEFEQDLSEVLERAFLDNVRKIMVLGIDANTSQLAVELAKSYPLYLYSAAGIHPNDSKGVGKHEINQIRNILESNPDIKAIGEIGLDFYRDWASKDEQVFVFGEMLSLAEEFNLPICLHVRESEEEVIAMLDPWYSELKAQHHPLVEKPGVFHSFDGSSRTMDWALAHNFKLGINGTITYKKNEALRNAVSEAGIDNLIIETDAPYLAPQLYRGKRNEPVYVKYVAEEISRVLDMELERVAEMTSLNAATLFGWEND